MTTSPLHLAVKRYEKAIATIEHCAEKLTVESVLEALIARDAVHAALANRSYDTPAIVISTIKELDDRLRHQTKVIQRLIKVADWQAVVEPSKKDWWWSYPSWLDRLDWLWELISLACFIGATTIFLDISLRLFSHGSDLAGLEAVLLPAIPTLLAGGSLTKDGREFTRRTLDNLGLPQRWWNLATLLLAIVALILAVMVHANLPQLANQYEKKGDQAYAETLLVNAEANYSRAMRLDPSQVVLHQKLGEVYEAMEDHKQAIEQYEIVTKKDWLEDAALEEFSYKAYDRLIQLHILQGKKDATHYAKAITHSSEAENRLNKTLAKKFCPQAKDARDKEKCLRRQRQGTSNQLDNHLHQILLSLYTLQKNRGWAQLELGNFGEAQTTLREAVNLFRDKAPAYCLLARALEGKEQPKSKPNQPAKNKQAAASKQSNHQEILQAWEQCLAYANQDDVEEAEFGSQARKRLKQLLKDNSHEASNQSANQSRDRIAGAAERSLVISKSS